MWDGMDRWRDGTLELRFRASGVVADRTPLFTVVTRAGRPPWSQHGLSHTRLTNGQFLELRATPGAGPWTLVRWTIGADGKRGKTTEVPVGASDDRPHTLTTVLEGPNTRVLLDGVQVAAFGETPELGGAFGILAAGGLSETLYVDLDRVEVRAP
jgi:hypothetical protein